MKVIFLYQLQFHVSDKIDDLVWDAFLLKAPGGHYAQSSAWAQVKSLLGWRVARILIEDTHRIVGGAQVLMRSIPCLGSIGYVPGGPLLIQDDPQVAQLLITSLQQTAQKNRIQYMLVQPRQLWPSFEERLLESGFRTTERHALAVSTLLLDLHQEPDQLLTAMRKSTRRNIRLSQKAGVIVREGTACDLSTSYHIILEACERKHLKTFSETYFTGLWDILHPRGYLHLFIAEYEGEAVATSLVISFGKTVIDTIGAWNGLHAKAHPNELLEWTIVLWAKAQGYCYFDFDGLTPEDDSRPAPFDAHPGATFFKLGFGGHSVLYPLAYEYLPNRLLRRLYTAIDRGRAGSPGIIKLERLVRGMGSG